MRLAHAEARVGELQAANASLRARLGEPPEAEPRQSQELPSAPPTPTTISAAARAQVHAFTIDPAFWTGVDLE